MKNKIYGTILLCPSTPDRVTEYTVFQVDNSKDITHLFRPDMIRLAHENNQALEFNEETGRGKRIEMLELPKDTVSDAPKAKVKNNDPVIAFIKNAPSIKPETLFFTLALGASLTSSLGSSDISIRLPLPVSSLNSNA